LLLHVTLIAAFAPHIYFHEKPCVCGKSVTVFRSERSVFDKQIKKAKVYPQDLNYSPPYTLYSRLLMYLY